MGWFDTDSKDKPQPAVSPAPATTPSTRSPSQAARSGSIVGERVHINGTIIADEELVVRGKVEGTIHARQSLRIAVGAEVKALVKGARVLLEGDMEGDLHALEAAVLGPTARLIGNIEAPSLQIQEGAFVKGSVQMPRPEAPPKPPLPKTDKPAATGSAGSAQAGQESTGAGKSAAPGRSGTTRPATATQS